MVFFEGLFIHLKFLWRPNWNRAIVCLFLSAIRLQPGTWWDSLPQTSHPLGGGVTSFFQPTLFSSGPAGPSTPHAPGVLKKLPAPVALAQPLHTGSLVHICPGNGHCNVPGPGIDSGCRGLPIIGPMSLRGKPRRKGCSTWGGGAAIEKNVPFCFNFMDVLF